MPDNQFDSEIASLKRVQGEVCSAANRLVWRAAMQRRMVRIAGLLRTLPSLVVSRGVVRSKGPAGWLVTAVDSAGGTEAVLEVVTRTTGRTVEELAAPIPIRIIRADLVALPRLEELILAGTVTADSGPPTA